MAATDGLQNMIGPVAKGSVMVQWGAMAKWCARLGRRQGKWLVCLAVAALVSVLALAPAQAQTEKVKFQGWMWNTSGGLITVQRVATQCWDPQQLAYQQIQPNALWSFATESERSFNCYTAFISANVLDQNNNLLFWFQIFTDFVAQTCYIYLFNPGGTTIFNVLPPASCNNQDTISYTMYVSGPAPSVAIVSGLQPIP